MMDKIIEILAENDVYVASYGSPVYIETLRKELAQQIEALFPKGDSEGLVQLEDLPSLYIEWASSIVDLMFGKAELEPQAGVKVRDWLTNILRLQQAITRKEAREMLMKLDRCSSYLEMNEVLKELMEGL